MELIKPVFRSYFLFKTISTIFFVAIVSVCFAQDKEDEGVKVRIVKIVDGDTTTLEKTMNEANVKDFTKQFENVRGKNVQVMITVENIHKDKQSSGKNSSSSSRQFNFDRSSGHTNVDSVIASCFSKFFMFNDSSLLKNFTWDDSLRKNFPKDFDFNFKFEDEANDFDFDVNKEDDDKNIIIKNKGGKTFIIKEEERDNEDNADVTNKENNTKTQTKTIIIRDDKTKTGKKVIVSTSVVVIDLDEDGKPDKNRRREESSFNFYPNPSDGNFILDLDLNGKEDVLVRITDMSGKEVYNEKVTGNGKINKAIKLNSDKNGTFIVTIKQGNKISNKKIIIE